MNKTGNIDIIKAYLGTKSLSYNNAFVGTYHLISVIPETNKLLYTTTDGNILPTSQSGIISNTYENELGILIFNNAITTIYYRVYSGKSTLLTMILPSSVESIGESAFSTSRL